MGYEVTNIVDCSSIVKAYERGAAFSVSQESVFAMMTPILAITRTQSRGIIDQIESQEALSAPEALLTAASPIDLTNLDKATDQDAGLGEKIIGSFFPGGVAGTIEDCVAFNKDCIPCLERLNLLGELDFESGVASFLDFWEEWLKGMYNNLISMLNTFKGVDAFIDLCALLDFIKDFVCVPDLARMLSALMALMSNLSFEFGGVFDLILSLAAPLLQPFLSNFVDILLRYLLLVIKPIECIIDSLQEILTKLDYNVLFENVKNIQTSGTRIPYIDVQKNFAVSATVSINTPAVIDAVSGGAISAQIAKDQANVEAAAIELRAIQAGASNVDGADSVAVATYRTQKDAAQRKYDQAIDERNLSELGELNKGLEEFQQGFKSSIYSLIDFLREAVEKVQAYFDQVFSELQKIMGEFLGGSGNFLELLSKKSGLVQMIEWISAIIDAFSTNLHCDDDEQDIKIERLIPTQQGFSVWTDDEGNVHLEEDPKLIAAAIDETVKALGMVPTGIDGAPAIDSVTAKDQDRGVEPTEQTPRQKLKSLIEFTGDPVLDSSIARVTEALTTPVNVVFKCPLQTTVSQTEQVNKWISELNTV